MDTDSVSLVVLVRVDRNNPVSDLDRFLALGVPSFRRWFEPGLVTELVLVVPHKDVRLVERRVGAASSIPIRVVDEALVAPQLSGYPANWIKQQVLKLALPAVVRTPWFVLLDADVIACRRIDRDVLFPRGRAIWQRELAGDHMAWWRGSGRVLNSGAVVDPTQRVFGVTPAVMHTESLLDLTSRIQALYPDGHWTEELLRLSREMAWTEYTLYWTHLLDTGRAADLYATAEDADSWIQPYAGDESVWRFEHIESRGTVDRLGSVFRPDASHLFFVFQSNVGYPLETIVKLIRPYICSSTHVSPSQRTQWMAHRAGYHLRRPLNWLRWKLRERGRRRARL